MEDDILKIIENVAKIPSFSSYEERLHPFIYKFIEENQIKCTIYQHFNNLIIEINENIHPTIAFTAHLDKIDHFLKDVDELDFTINQRKIKGQLDDSVGVGICLYLLLNSEKFKLPHTLFLFSEMEESYGLFRHPEMLKDNGKNLESQIGAKRISEFLMNKSLIPSIFITIDTTPLFRGNKGVALYSKFWERTYISPTDELINKTNSIENLMQKIFPNILFANNVNDYLIYGSYFAYNNHHIPSIALEPSIYPYHTIGEEVYIDDIIDILYIIQKFISYYLNSPQILK